MVNADPSRRAAVARLIAHRAAAGLPPCSSDPGGYCQARRRLPERFFAAGARSVGRNLDARVDRRWLWKDRRAQRSVIAIRRQAVNFRRIRSC